MPTLANKFNWGSEIKNVNDTLYNQLNDSYASVANVLNTKPSTMTSNENPPADSPTNLQLRVGDFWINSVTDNSWIMTSRTTNTSVTWTLIT